MNKFGIVLGVAALVTLAGCKDPNYNTRVKRLQTKNAGVTTAAVKADASKTEVQKTDVQQPPVATTQIQPVEKKTCKCPPGTKHTEPCMCGADDCTCVVVAKTKPAIPVATTPAAPEYTTYIVQRGDYLAKISAKYNVTIASIKKLNNMTSDVVRVGQKLKLPGKIEVGEQAVPAQSVAKAASATANAYTGATKDYVVKSGDTLGAIAYGNGINIRQLKALNGLTNDTLKVGQKLKIPAEVQKTVAKPAKEGEAKAVASAVKTSAAKPADAKASVAKPVAKAAEVPAKDSKAAEAAQPAVDKKVEDAAAEAQPTVDAGAAEVAAAQPTGDVAAQPKPATVDYVVQEGDDMTGVAVSCGVSPAVIRELNNLPDDAQLVPGKTIKLPAEAQQ